MKKALAITCLVVGGSLATPMVTYAGEDADMDRSQPTTFVKDSAITTKIKAKLASLIPDEIKHKAICFPCV